jgi:hypothetical protein
VTEAGSAAETEESVTAVSAAARPAKTAPVMKILEYMELKSGGGEGEREEVTQPVEQNRCYRLQLARSHVNLEKRQNFQQIFASVAR